ncbi:hypothetical protein PSTG_18599, partial [Puccinia striiformis f. sp. tritici PST-78]
MTALISNNRNQESTMSEEYGDIQPWDGKSGERSSTSHEFSRSGIKITSGYRHIAYFSPPGTQSPIFLSDGKWEVDGVISSVDSGNGL